MSETIKTDKERFSELLDEYPRLAGFWDRSNPNPCEWTCDLERVRAVGGALSGGECVIVDCLVSIWSGGLKAGTDDFRIDFSDIATLDRESRRPLIGWLLNPFWL